MAKYEPSRVREKSLEAARADIDVGGGASAVERPPLSSLGRAKIVNALSSLPVGYAFHSDEPAMRCIAWAQDFPVALHNAAVEVIASIGLHKPEMIGGSGWINEANRRMAIVMADADMTVGAGDPGMSLADLAKSLVTDKAQRAADLQAEAVASAEREQADQAARDGGVAAAFAPPPAGSGPTVVVLPAEEEEEDMSNEA